jgi:hypothetical protein
LRRKDFDLPALTEQPDKRAIGPRNRGLDEQDLRLLEGERLLEDTFKKDISLEELQEAGQQKQEALNGSAELFNARNIELKTDLSPREVVAASKLLFIADRYNIDGLRDFVYDLLRLKVSQFRKGRGEFIQGLHAEERRQQGMEGGGFRPIDMLLGKLGGGGGG